MQQYKAIIFDLDGTAIPNKRDGMPSENLIKLVQKLKQNFFVCAATARPISICQHIFNSLELTSPCVISGGTEIIDPVTKKVLWEKIISEKTVDTIMELTKGYDYKLLTTSETASSLVQKTKKGPEHILYIEPVKHADVDSLLTKLGQISGIACTSAPTYVEGYFSIHITHEQATKKHGLEVLFQMLNIKKEEAIGFGDGNNDLPIFEAVGYKVAMGNGTQELKDLADLIAPSAEDDGMAKVLEELVV
jgi:HAD superfamily hydrolase (TIGR01484 family)